MHRNLQISIATLIHFLFFLSTADGQVFSNEIHYDNSGQDMNEKIEVAGPTGTNLSGWSIVFYDGSTGTTYATANLSGVLPNSCTVSGQNIGVSVIDVLAVTGSTIQGLVDGWALINPMNAVVEFLSYEGVFTATNGPATGLVSTNINAFEDGTGTIDGSIQRTGISTWVTSLNTNTFGSCNTTQLAALPIELLSFSTKINNQSIDLTWTTASEKNNDFFSIERSGDGKQYVAIGIKDGGGTTSKGDRYTFTDEAPLQGANYYRLKQVDTDGNYEYSPIRMVQWGKSGTVAIYPNPVTDATLRILYTSSQENEIQISLLDGCGKTVYQQSAETTKGDNQLTLNMGILPANVYWLKITDGAETQVIPVVVQ